MLKGSLPHVQDYDIKVSRKSGFAIHFNHCIPCINGVPGTLLVYVLVLLVYKIISTVYVIVLLVYEIISTVYVL